MSYTAEPIRLHPRLLPRRWGRERAPAWCASAKRPSAPIGEIWIAHPHNTTSMGAHFGAALAEAPQTMLGELGRAPPRLRLVIADEPSDPLSCEGPVALWRMLECPLDAAVNLYEGNDAPAREMRCRRGDLLRVNGDTRIIVPAGVTALEARASFAPNNHSDPKRVQRVLAEGEKKHRATWLRDPAMSVEVWTLPELSFLKPDGETCHVLMALTPGVAIDGEPLSRGDGVFLPAEGRQAKLTGKGAQVAVVYPDLIPTQIWKHAHAPKPAALALDPALLERTHMNKSARADESNRRAA
jgi:hypothetical protein